MKSTNFLQITVFLTAPTASKTIFTLLTLSAILCWANWYQTRSKIGFSLGTGDMYLVDEWDSSKALKGLKQQTNAFVFPLSECRLAFFLSKWLKSRFNLCLITSLFQLVVDLFYHTKRQNEEVSGNFHSIGKSKHDI